MRQILDLISEVVNFHRGNFTPTTIVWTLTGTIGSIFAARNLRDSIGDARALAASNTPHRRRGDLTMLASQAIRQDSIRLSQMLVVVITGLIVSSTTPTLSDSQRAQLHIPYWTPTGIAVTVALLFIVGGIAVQAVLDRRVRTRIYRDQGAAP